MWAPLPNRSSRLSQYLVPFDTSDDARTTRNFTTASFVNELAGDSVQIRELVEAYWRMDAKALRMHILVVKARKEETSETGLNT